MGNLSQETKSDFDSVFIPYLILPKKASKLITQDPYYMSNSYGCYTFTSDLTKNSNFFEIGEDGALYMIKMEMSVCLDDDLPLSFLTIKKNYVCMSAIDGKNTVAKERIRNKTISLTFDVTNKKCTLDVFFDDKGIVRSVNIKNII